MRTNPPLRLPDAINGSVTKNFTQVPTDMLRNPNLSGKAKALLCILLSNKDGWVSYLAAIKQVMKEREDAIRGAIAELEEYGYLVRIRYRCQKTKVWKGSFWAYSDLPNSWDYTEHQTILEARGFELVINENTKATSAKATCGLPTSGLSTYGKSQPNNINNKNTKDKNTNSSSAAVTQKMFEEYFWEIYPRKIDKGKALSSWNKICNRPPKSRPTGNDIKNAILSQIKSERWQDREFIPHPTTWLNQSRWLDDPSEMKGHRANGHHKPGYRNTDPDKQYKYTSKTIIA